MTSPSPSLSVLASRRASFNIPTRRQILLIVFGYCFSFLAIVANSKQTIFSIAYRSTSVSTLHHRPSSLSTVQHRSLSLSTVWQSASLFSTAAHCTPPLRFPTASQRFPAALYRFQPFASGPKWSALDPIVVRRC